MYSRLYDLMRKYLYRGAKEIRGYLRELEDTQWLSRSELETRQLEKVQRLVSYAYEYVPFYRERYQSEDIHPEDIKTLKDFQSLPFLNGDDVKNHREALLSTAYRGNYFEETTGGSTGHPMAFYKDRSTAYWAYAVETRNRAWYGVCPGDKAAWVWGYLRDFSGWSWKERLIAYVKRRRFLNTRTMTESKMREFAEILVKWQPTWVKAYPSALYLFARYLQEIGITNITPKLIETTAEKVFPSQRQLFEEVFKSPVADFYGCWELYSVAYQCPEGGLHVNEDRYLELVADGRVVKPGEMGEVAVTSLTQYAMPFIRYKNGDLGVYERDGCSCGRGMPVLREIVGRKSDLLLDTDGRIVYWPGFALYSVRNKPEVYQYQIYQPDREHIEIRLVCKQTVDSAFLEEVRNELQPDFSGSMHISVKLVDRIELTSAGKHRFVISDVKPDYI